MWWVVVVIFFFYVYWWCIYQEVWFLLVILTANVFLEMLRKEHVAEEPHLQQVQPVVMEMTVDWWRTPDPHFLYLCLTVPRCLTPFGRRDWVLNEMRSQISIKSSISVDSDGHFFIFLEAKTKTGETNWRTLSSSVMYTFHRQHLANKNMKMSAYQCFIVTAVRYFSAWV